MTVVFQYKKGDFFVHPGASSCGRLEHGKAVPQAHLHFDAGSNWKVERKRLEWGQERHQLLARGCSYNVDTSGRGTDP